MIWKDIDQDGIQDDGEDGISNISITLYDDSDNKLDSTNTDENGNYKFCGLENGDYYIDIDVPSEYDITHQDIGDDDTKDSDIDSDGKSGATISNSDNMTIDVTH